MPFYRMAGLTVRIDAPGWMIGEEFGPFVCEAAEPQLHCEIRLEPRPLYHLKGLEPTTEHIMCNVFDLDGAYHICYHNDRDIPSYIIARRNWSHMAFYVDSTLYSARLPGEMLMIRRAVSHALCTAFSTALSLRGGLLLRCTTIEHQAGLIFASSQGAEKEARPLWRRQNPARPWEGNTSVACRFTESGPELFSLPWGALPAREPGRRSNLRALVFWEHAQGNHVRHLTDNDFMLSLAAHSILPLPWSDRLAALALDTAYRLVESIEGYLLQCPSGVSTEELLHGRLFA